MLRERVNEVHDNYYSKLTTFEEINEAYQWFDIRDREYFQSRTRINERINSFEQTKAYDYVLQRSTLTQSSNSSKSPQNSTSSIRSRRAKAAAKAASLQIEMNFIDQETEYKKQQMLYESEYKRQQMLKEYAKAKAEEETMKKLQTGKLFCNDKVMTCKLILIETHMAWEVHNPCIDVETKSADLRNWVQEI